MKSFERRGFSSRCIGMDEEMLRCYLCTPLKEWIKDLALAKA
jgi:hypothetical protein